MKEWVAETYSLACVYSMDTGQQTHGGKTKFQCSIRNQKYNVQRPQTNHQAGHKKQILSNLLNGQPIGRTQNEAVNAGQGKPQGADPPPFL